MLLKAQFQLMIAVLIFSKLALINRTLLNSIFCADAIAEVSVALADVGIVG